MTGQIPFDLAAGPDFSFSNFEVGDCNLAAVTAVRAWPDWPAPILMLIGPSGAGKTHLGCAWAQAHDGTILFGADTFDPADVPPRSVVFIDAADAADETALFAVMNMALEGRVPGLLLAAPDAPQNWNIGIPDLRSRLRNTPIAALEEHDETILEPIIRKLFEDCGRAVNADVVRYLIKHHDRSILAMRRCVHNLDFAARQAKRDMTRHFVAAYLRR